MIRNRLDDIRLMLGYRRAKDFAAYLGVSQSHYSQWANNIIQPEYEKMLIICEKIREHPFSKEKNLNNITVEYVFYRVADE